MTVNKKKLFFDLLYVILIVGVLIGGYMMISILKSNAKECLANPFVYSANRMEGDVWCSCTEAKDGQVNFFYFNKTEWWTGEKNR